MRKDRIIYLKQQGPGKNKYGDAKKSTGKVRQVFAAKKSIRQSEFYQAAVSDFKPELTFEIWLHEYRGESVLKFGGKDYRIIRTFEKSDKEVELICEGLSNHGQSS